MNNLFLGLLFLVIDFKATFGAVTMNFVPDFVGYILMYKGFEEMQGECQHYLAAKPWATALAIYSGVLFAADLLGITLGADLLMWMLSLAATAARFYVTHILVKGVADLEQAHAADLGSGKLKTMWQYWVIFAGISQLIRWIPLVGSVAAVAAAILGIVFMVSFYKTKNAWERTQA